MDGTYVTLDERCDGNMNCDDGTDEEDCKVFVTFPGYNKFLVPPPLGNASHLVINVSVIIDDIIALDENAGYFKTKITLIRRWVNKQLIYQNLKRNADKNQIATEDMEKMWKPWVVFENTEYEGDIKDTDKEQKIMKIDPHQDFLFKLADTTNLRNTRLFKGDENVISYQ